MVMAGQTLKDVVLPMVPAPVIAGRVFDPHGEPLAAALVRAYMRRYTPYGTQLRSVKKGMTNDMGEFRLFGLNFGEYFVSAAYSDRDRAAAVSGVQLSPNISRADDGYATIFYDGAEEISHARAARLAPGAGVNGLNINLRDSARFRISGNVLPLQPDTKIVLAPRGSDLTEADYLIQPDPAGVFEIRAVSPGAYLLLATAADGALSSDVIAVNVTDTDVDQVRVSLQQTISVPARVSWESSPGTNPADLRIRLLRSNTEFDQQITARAAPDGLFTLEHVVPSAEYDVVVEPLPSGIYVKRILSGGRNILQGKSRLTNDPLQILLASATDTLDIHAGKNGNPAAGARIVLIPAPLLRRRADRYLTGFTDESGDLRFSAVPPGSYTAYAFEDLEPGAWFALAYDAAATSRFRDRAVFVSTGENGTRTAQLTVIPAAETVAGFQ